MTPRSIPVRTICWLVLLAWIGVCSGTLVSAGEAGKERYKGLTLAAALTRLQHNGLRIIFSSDLVRPDMIVSEEPRGRWPHEILEELLATHGLRATRGPAGTRLVIAAPKLHSPAAAVRTTTKVESERPPHVIADTVIVNGRDPWSRKNHPAATELVGRQELQTLPAIGSDALLPLGRLPGVAATEGMGGWSVRGGSHRDAKIILDGLELREPYHVKDRGGPVSIINERTVGGIGLLGGAFPVEYGGHMGAVVDLVTLVPSRRIDTELALDPDEVRAVNQGRTGSRLGWMASARRGDASRLLDALGADPSYRPTYWDAFGKADYRLNEKTTVAAHLLAGDDEVEGGGIDETITTVDEPGTFRSEHRNRYAWVTLQHAMSSSLAVQTVVSHSRIATDRIGSNRRVVEVRDARWSAVLGLKQDWGWQSARQLLKWGLDLKRVRADYAYASTPAIDGRRGIGGLPLSAMTIQQAPRGSDIGVYIADRIQVVPRMTVELGVRWDDQSYVRGRGTVGPRVNAVYAVSPRTDLRVGWGHYYQAPGIHELQVEDGVREFLPAERSEHRLVSVVHELDYGQVQLSAYQKHAGRLNPRFENLFDPFGFFPEADGDRVRIAPEAARAEGLELVVRSPAGTRVGWWVGYSLARTEDRIDGRWVPRKWDQRHAVTFGASWKPGDPWDLSVAGIVHSGRPTTPLTGAVQELSDGVTTIVPVIGARNSLRLPTYSRIDARASRSLRILRSDVRAVLTVTNVFDRDNGCCMAFAPDLSRLGAATPVEPRMRPGLPRVMTIGLSWRF